MNAQPTTVVETSDFQKRARGLFSADEIEKLINFLAYYPTTGVVIPGTGGVWKWRWASGGKGKRGGARVIYFYHNEELPLFLFTAYAKSTTADLASGQKTELRKIVSEIVASYVRKK